VVQACGVDPDAMRSEALRRLADARESDASRRKKVAAAGAASSGGRKALDEFCTDLCEAARPPPPLARGSPAARPLPASLSRPTPAAALTPDPHTTTNRQQVRRGKVDPVIGRQAEVRRVIQILGRRSKNNPILLGEPGVGKTAIAEGLAYCVVRAGRRRRGLAGAARRRRCRRPAAAPPRRRTTALQSLETSFNPT